MRQGPATQSPWIPTMPPIRVLWARSISTCGAGKVYQSRRVRPTVAKSRPRERYCRMVAGSRYSMNATLSLSK